MDDDTIDIPSPGITLAFGSVGTPVIVVIHNEFGRLPQLVEYAETLASLGAWRVLVPDFYNGVATADAARAAELWSDLSPESLELEVDGLIRAARHYGSERAAALGFGPGGRIALNLALTGELDAVVAYSATLSEAEHSILPCPVLLHVAERDEWGADDHPDAFVDRLRDHGTPVERHDYPGSASQFAVLTARDSIPATPGDEALAATSGFLYLQLSAP